MSTEVHFVIDEAASIGALPPIEDALDKLRSYGVRLILAYQSMGQLQQCWPDGRAQVLLSNTTQIFFGVSDHQTADYVSARLGATTIAVESSSTSTSHNSGSGKQWGSRSISRSTSRSYQKRELLQPAEVTALPPNIAITFAPGVPPISTKLVRHFEEPRAFSGPSILSSARNLFRSLTFLAFSLFVVGAVVAPDHSQRPSTPSVDHWRTYGSREPTQSKTKPTRRTTGPKLDRGTRSAPR